MKKINFLFKRLLALAVVAAMLTLVSCGDDDEGGDPAPTMNLYETMQEDDDLTELSAYIDANATLKAALESETEYTFFAPTDAAFEKLRNTLQVESLDLVSSEVIGAVLAFHVGAGAQTQSELTGGTITTLQGEDVVVNSDGTILTGGSDDQVEILDADIEATNGIMHKTETILIPPTLFAYIGTHLGKVSQTILLGADFTILADGLAKADEFATANSQTLLSATLSGSTVLTVFAPTNATFEAASITAETYTGEQWYGIIANHVVTDDNTVDSNTTVDEAEMETAATFSTAAGGTLAFFNDTGSIPADNGVGIYIDSNGDVDFGDSGTFTNFDAEVAIIDAALASNGKIHVIAGVLAP